MKKIKDGALKFIANTAKKSAIRETDSACLCIAYQPKMPEKLNKTEKQN